MIKMSNLLFVMAIIMASLTCASGNVLAADTPETHLYLFSDNMEKYSATESAYGSLGTEDELIEGVWSTSGVLGGEEKQTQYHIIADDGENGNKVIGLVPSLDNGGSLCVLNYAADIEAATEYIFTSDVRGYFYESMNPVYGIRIADCEDETSYYELAICYQSVTCCITPRFTKVQGGKTSTPYGGSKPEIKYEKSGTAVPISSVVENKGTGWMTVALVKKGNTICWSVSDRVTKEVIYRGEFTDSEPLFEGMGRLQLFAYGGGRSDAPTLFDNVQVRKLGAEIYRDYRYENCMKFEASWFGALENPPIVMTADYDEKGRMLNVQNYGVLSDCNGYFSGNEVCPDFGTVRKLFVWDSKTNKPLYEAQVYKEAESYIAPGEEYVLQRNRGEGMRFSDGEGILFEPAKIVKVSPDVQLYINGYLYDGEVSDGALDKFLGNAQGNIRFEKSAVNGEEYDRIFVKYYVVGQVTSTAVNATGDGIVTFVTIDDAPHSGITVPKRFELKITKGEKIQIIKNGIEIAFEDIRKDNIIALAMDFNILQRGNSGEPEFAEIIVSDKTVTGTVNDFDEDFGTYTVGNKTYKYVGFVDFLENNISIGAKYEFYIDPFGRIAGEGKVLRNIPDYAILEEYDVFWGRATLVLADGTVTSHRVSDDSYLSADEFGDYLYCGIGVKNDVQNRVVTYIRHAGNTVSLYPATLDASVVKIDGKEYNPNTKKLGPVSVEEIKIINAHDYIEYGEKIEDYSSFSASDFNEGVGYTAYAFGEYGAGVYDFMIITSKGPAFTRDSRFAVVTKAPYLGVKDSNTCVEVLYQGKEAKLYWDESINAYYTDGTVVSAGDVFFFTTDREGYVHEAYKIYDIQSKELKFTLPDDEIGYNEWTTDFGNTTADIALVRGAITEVKNNSITFGVVSKIYSGDKGGYCPIIDGNIYESPSGSEGMYTYGIADDCRAYIYDGTTNRLPGYKHYAFTSVSPSELKESLLVEFEDEYIYDAEKSTLFNGVAMIVDGDIVCIFEDYSIDG